jgi:cysteine desulfurase/selenocysteine lyase
MGIAVTDVASKGWEQAFRDQMPVTQSWAYFDHAAVSPIPQRSAQAMQRWIDQATQQGDVSWLQWSQQAEAVRGFACQILGCKTSEIALIPNTTYGINIVAMGFPWRPGDSLVVPANEYPSNLLPWKSLARLGVDVRTVPVDSSGILDIDRIAHAVDATTRLVAVSWVGYASGYRANLTDLCQRVHRAGAKLFVDAIQGLGVFHLDTRDIPIDYAAADGHKWMLGPEGAGILYIRESNLDQLAPIMIGWNSVQSSHEFHADSSRLKKDASRYEGGASNLVGLIGLANSLELLCEMGYPSPDNPIARKVLLNAAMVRDAIQIAGGELNTPPPRSWDDATASGIINFRMPGKDSASVRKALLQRGVVLSVRHGNLRAATHAYNNQEDVERLRTALEEA